jgi:hypothetical protein
MVRWFQENCPLEDTLKGRVASETVLAGFRKSDLIDCRLMSKLHEVLQGPKRDGAVPGLW